MKIVLIILTLSFNQVIAQQEDSLKTEFDKFQSELHIYKALDRIKDGHIINPYWGIDEFNIRIHQELPRKREKECSPYKLKWVNAPTRLNTMLIKGKEQPFCNFPELLNPYSEGITSEKTTGSSLGHYSHLGTSIIGDKYVVMRYQEVSEQSLPPHHAFYYFENLSTELTRQEEEWVNDTTLSIYSNVWFFIPALDDDYLGLRERIINDTTKYVEEMIGFAKKMSLAENQNLMQKELTVLDSNQTYICKYSIQQFFDHDILHNGIFDNQKNANSSTLLGYKIDKFNVSLSPKEFTKTGYYLSDYKLNEQQKGVYPIGDKYAVFYEYNLQYQQAGYYTIENVCLCEKKEPGMNLDIEE